MICCPTTREVVKCTTERSMHLFQAKCQHADMWTKRLKISVAVCHLSEGCFTISLKISRALIISAVWHQVILALICWVWEPGGHLILQHLWQFFKNKHTFFFIDYYNQSSSWVSVWHKHLSSLHLYLNLFRWQKMNNSQSVHSHSKQMYSKQNNTDALFCAWASSNSCQLYRKPDFSN